MIKSLSCSAEIEWSLHEVCAKEIDLEPIEDTVKQRHITPFTALGNPERETISL